MDPCVPDQAPPVSRAPSQSLPASSAAPVPSDPTSGAPSGGPAPALVRALRKDADPSSEHQPSFSSESLESKIHNFLQGNSAFNAFDLHFSGPAGGSLSPAAGADAQDGTPVRDEGGGTPTQDEMMDKAVAAPPQPGAAQNGQPYRQRAFANHDPAEPGASAARYPTSRPGDAAPGSDGGARAAEPAQMASDRGWYNDGYPEGGSLSRQLGGFGAAALRGAKENLVAGLYPYPAEQPQQPANMASQQGPAPAAASAFFSKTLPPVPVIPPPPQGFENPLPGPSGAIIAPEPPPQQQLHAGAEERMGEAAGSVIGGMVVHDHQHKSVFHPSDSVYEQERAPPPHPEKQHYQEAPEQFHHEPRYHNDHFFQDNTYLHPDEPYPRHPGPGPGAAPQRYPRVRGHLTPPLSPSEDPYFPQDYQRLGPPPPPPPPPRFALRRPPPHLEMRHPGLRPPHRPPPPPPPPPHHFPRGPPCLPFPPFRGPDPRLRGKRPGPMGRGGAGPMFAPKRPFLPPRY